MNEIAAHLHQECFKLALQEQIKFFELKKVLTIQPCVAVKQTCVINDPKSSLTVCNTTHLALCLQPSTMLETRTTAEGGANTCLFKAASQSRICILRIVRPSFLKGPSKDAPSSTSPVNNGAVWSLRRISWLIHRISTTST